MEGDFFLKVTFTLTGVSSYPHLDCKSGPLEFKPISNSVYEWTVQQSQRDITTEEEFAIFHIEVSSWQEIHILPLTKNWNKNYIPLNEREYYPHTTCLRLQLSSRLELHCPHTKHKPRLLFTGWDEFVALLNPVRLDLIKETQRKVLLQQWNRN